MIRDSYAEIEGRINKLNGEIEIPELSSYALLSTILGKEI
jgi:hypothetical protein